MANTGFLIQPKKKKEVLPSEYTTMGDFPTVGQQYVYYKALDTGMFYKWDGDSYEVINPAMDVNNQFTSVSGLSQATMDNPLDSPTYRVLNTTACPVEPSEEVQLLVFGTYNNGTQSFEYNGSISGALDNDLTVAFTSICKVDGVETLVPGDTFTINAGNTTYSNSIYYPISGVVTDIVITFVSVNPNPNGSKTIIY